MALTGDSHRQKISRALWLTKLGIRVERILQAFWPLYTLLLTYCGAALLGVGAHSPPGLWPYVPLFMGGLAIAAVFGGVIWMRRTPAPSAFDRLDRSMAGRPLSAMRDRLAAGRGDGASEAIWRAHQRQVVAATTTARGVPARPQLQRYDVYGLRLMAMVFFFVALLFGEGPSAPHAAPSMPAQAASPAWEGWAAPPAYTGVPGIYLDKETTGELILPQGTQFEFRFYDGDFTIQQDISDVAPPLTLPRSGTLALKGARDAAWRVTMIPDAPPEVALLAGAKFSGGETILPFTAKDDYAVSAGVAEITLDLARVDRRFGLAPPPDPRVALKLALPIGLQGTQGEVTSQIRESLSTHPWANLPVSVTLTVRDDAGQSASSTPKQLILPAKRFFEPNAKALAELRRDLLWSKQNAPRVLRLLRAILWPDGGSLRSNPQRGALTQIIDELQAAIAADELTDARVDQTAMKLWLLALDLEQGSIENARKRLQRAQERLAEAMRSGASPDEIAELMDELRAAKAEYLEMLAQQAEPSDSGPDMPNSDAEPGPEVTQDEIDALMDEIQRLMEAGEMEQAALLMSQLETLLENLRVQQSGSSSGGGPGQPGGGAGEQLRQQLRQQQSLSDQVFRELQDRYNGRSRPGTDDPGADIAEAQEGLLEQLEDLAEGLADDPGGQAQQELDEARRSMREALRALRDDTLPEALEQQGEAMDRLRAAIRRLAEGQGEGRAGEGEQSNPLGMGPRSAESGDIVPDAQTPQGRAQDLLEELRRRLGERQRSQLERDYLERLLDRF